MIRLRRTAPRALRRCQHSYLLAAGLSRTPARTSGDPPAFGAYCRRSLGWSAAAQANMLYRTPPRRPVALTTRLAAAVGRGHLNDCPEYARRSGRRGRVRGRVARNSSANDPPEGREMPVLSGFWRGGAEGIEPPPSSLRSRCEASQPNFASQL